MSWSIGFSALTREQLQHAINLKDFEATYDYVCEYFRASFGSIPDIMFEFAEYNEAVGAVRGYAEDAEDTGLNLEFPRIYDEEAVSKVAAEFAKLDFNDMDNFDDYEDIRDVCIDLRDMFQDAQMQNQIVILYRMP